MMSLLDFSRILIVTHGPKNRIMYQHGSHSGPRMKEWQSEPLVSNDLALKHVMQSSPRLASLSTVSEVLSHTQRKTSAVHVLDSMRQDQVTEG